MRGTIHPRNPNRNLARNRRSCGWKNGDYDYEQDYDYDRAWKE
jgi:hypothetical protein